ncbi:hypothetical protein Y032_0044g1011 [Ancylostoma ceylanicum]|uniref:Uncharacterized protein n=1 Tax=Ancylostoma ceylanicum TaxID=53326 RepID=A0A016UE94_9BILA|nr:hypothetical protein Y032_0044g1011 [Ancylostoma ceylanicum]
MASVAMLSLLNDFSIFVEFRISQQKMPRQNLWKIRFSGLKNFGVAQKGNLYWMRATDARVYMMNSRRQSHRYRSSVARVYDFATAARSFH